MTDVQELESELMHARVYDPAKAHEYYLRTRSLKGRGRSGPDISSRAGGGGHQGGTGGSSNNPDIRDSREKNLDQRIEELRAKVDQLREVLHKRVQEAKGRAGVKEPDKKESSTTSKTKDSKSSTKDGKPDKPLTEKQKADKRKASKEQYEKENRTSKVHEVEALTNIVKDLRERISKLPKPANHEKKSGHSDGRSDHRDGGNGR